MYTLSLLACCNVLNSNHKSVDRIANNVRVGNAVLVQINVLSYILDNIASSC